MLVNHSEIILCTIIISLYILQDLEAYANSYTGLARLYRLMYIADHCPTLRVEALKMAISYVMQTYNVNLYQQLHKKLQVPLRQVNFIYYCRNRRAENMVYFMYIMNAHAVYIK